MFMFVSGKERKVNNLKGEGRKGKGKEIKPISKHTKSNRREKTNHKKKHRSSDCFSKIFMTNKTLTKGENKLKQIKTNEKNTKNTNQNT